MSSPKSASSNNFKPITPKSYSRARAEHGYFKSPTSTAERETSRRKEIEAKYKHVTRTIKRKNLSLQNVKAELHELKVLSEQRLQNLENQFPNILKKLMLNEAQRGQVKNTKGMRYDEEIKKFAVTLHYYSPKAYDFVRDYLTLPHPGTLTSWMRSTDCNPGFNIDVLDRITEAKSQDTKNMLSDVVLQIDEMSIHKDTVWDNNTHQFMGFVDFGVGQLTGDEPLATNALVCMLAGLTGGWKCSIGYIFTDKVDGQQMKSFVSRAFHLLEERDFNVLSLTSDGNTANVSMFESLGVQEKIVSDVPDYEDIISLFPNPANASKSVGCVYDMVHMLKLWRNLIASCLDVKWEHGTVSWKYIENVHNLQEYEKIVAANKLHRQHIQFQQHKMKAKLAAQALSLSVADAIDFCRDDLKLPAFEGSEATTAFIRKLDKCFDILNSRNPAQFGDKGPLRASNINEKASFLEEFAKDILKMTYKEKTTRKGVIYTKDKLICQGARKRAAIGTVVTIKSVLDIAYRVLFRSEGPQKYVLTYRFCQDLLELFFNKVRGRCGRNNNPNAVEFKHIMKKIWHQNLLKSTSTGNCVVQVQEGEIPGGLLPLKSIPKRRILDDVEDLSAILPDHYGLNDSSMFYKNCLAYIAGNITRVLSERIKCELCVRGLLESHLDPMEDNLKQLIARKQRGGLFQPCRSVFMIIEKADVIIKELIKMHNGPPRIKNLDLRISQTVLKRLVGRQLFPHLTSHVLDFDIDDGESHYGKLIKDVVMQFTKIRLYDYGKRFQRSGHLSMRHSLNKQIVLYRNE